MKLRSAPVALTTLAAALALGSSSVQAADPNLARNLAATCANCHGTNGKSQGGIEPLAGVEKERLLTKLRDFRSGAKPATIMHQISKGYSEEQLDMIAGWFAAQK
ncbi:MAG TPA: c-type cytochrome [Rhodocyclaceae bacterium]|nr:c-type cytochrome [Rhodocyclaceae bacterium]HMV54572.1 c-type cytochrome [Rhodocyclaceae bacterium]HMZ84913.1 c-type cytochrome [Rhodocyclaceae bacterium]HNA04515.1 c-type cytochrome [Rhodocyclaceae bacterium]HNB79608.1 c-type cytochrome [Rhodocyclaceae bacterium]